MKRRWLWLNFPMIVICALFITLADSTLGVYSFMNPTSGKSADSISRNRRAESTTTSETCVYKAQAADTGATDTGTTADVAVANTGVATNIAEEATTTVVPTCTTHTYSDWQVVTEATANSCGLETRTCTVCGYVETEEIDPLVAEYNSVLIPSANIVVDFAVTDLNQTNVDMYGAVCDVNFFNTYFGTGDIIISGHRTHTIGDLYKTAIGDNITINLNGECANYTVVVSESATPTENDSEFVGDSTGTDFIATPYSQQALRLYTCYGEERWIVIALRVQ